MTAAVVIDFAAPDPRLTALAERLATIDRRLTALEEGAAVHRLRINALADIIAPHPTAIEVAEHRERQDAVMAVSVALDGLRDRVRHMLEAYGP